MKSNIYGTGDKRAINPDWFTGKTWMKVVSEKIGSRGHDIYHVHFERGSRTKLHSHNGDQVLIATRGGGSLEIFGRRGKGGTGFAIRMTGRTVLNDGDIVFVPAGTLHTHGSAGRNNFAHIAINVLPRKNSAYRTAWYDVDSGRASAI